MRIVTRQELLALPTPVMYAEVRNGPYSRDAIKIKLENTENGWYYTPLNLVACIEADGPTARYDAFDKAVDDSQVDIPIKFGMTYIDEPRYGQDSGIMYAVVDLEAMRQLHQYLGTVLAAAESTSVS